MKNKKSLGQHWLQNRAILDQIADLAVVPDVDLCLEIGPGLGTLTSSLLRRFPEVIAVEYDHDLARKLPASFPGKNLRVIEGDILTTEIAPLVADRPYVVAGNIPYYITSPIVRRMLAVTPRPEKIVLLMQKEVARRIVAIEGDYNLLALMVQNLAEAELGPVVQAAEFTPPPKVDSQVLVLTPLSEPAVDPASLQLVARGFTNPRKKLARVLADEHISRDQWLQIFDAEGIDPDVRAEDLSLWAWEDLYQALEKHNSQPRSQG